VFYQHNYYFFNKHFQKTGRRFPAEIAAQQAGIPGRLAHPAISETAFAGHQFGGISRAGHLVVLGL